MDALTLARMQFGFGIGFHFLFAATTLGWTLFILIAETLYLKTRREHYRQISTFLARLLGVIFVVGVASGVLMEFSFGTNWAGFSRLMGDTFGPPLAAETITAFSLESVFLAILVFGRQKVSARMYWLAACLVFFGAQLSGFWIVAANSWMHTPSGFRLVEGRAVLVDFWRALFNASTLIRCLHTLVAGWITGTAAVAGVAAYYLVRKRHQDFSRALLRIALILFIILPLVQLFLGHASAVNVDHLNPEKSAAMEGVFKTSQDVPLLVFGIPDEKNQSVHLGLGIPHLLSFLVSGDLHAQIRGLNEFARRDWPPVNVVFTSFHIMVAIGFILIGSGLVGGWLLFTSRLESAPWFLRLLLVLVPLPYLANTFGWIGTEMGRQPWIVYRVLRTAEAASAVVSAGSIFFSLATLILIYFLILSVFIAVVMNHVRTGPGGE